MHPPSSVVGRSEREESDVADLARPAPATSRQSTQPAVLRARVSISFSASRSRCTIAATRSGSSSAGTLSCSVSWCDQDVLAGQEAVGVDAHQRLDAAHAGADRRLAEQLHDAELPGALRVRAAAQLARPVADADDPHHVAVLLAEQRHRAGRAGLVDAA